MDVPLQNGQVPTYDALIGVQINLAGALLGALFSTLLFGIFLQQALLFYLGRSVRKQPLDAALVGLVTATSAAIFVAEICWMFGYFVTNWGTTIFVERYFSAPWIARLALENLVNCLCQSFFTRRAWRLYQRNVYLAIALGLCVAANFAVGIYQCVRLATSFNATTIFPVLSAAMSTSTQAHYIGGAGVDMLICLIITSKLARVKKASNGFNRQTESILKRLLIASMTTAGLTTVFAICTAIVSIPTVLNGGLYVPFTMVLARIIAISMIFSVSIATKSGDRSDGASSAPGAIATTMHQQTSKPFGPYQSRSPVHGTHTVESLSVRLDRVEETDHEEKAVSVNEGH